MIKQANKLPMMTDDFEFTEADRLAKPKPKTAAKYVRQVEFYRDNGEEEEIAKLHDLIARDRSR